MSKSRGNGIEPKTLISRYGTDALRLAFIIGSTAGQDVIISENKVSGYSKFINKLWNAAKFIQSRVSTLEPFSQDFYSTKNLDSSKWILNEIAQLSKFVSTEMDNYRISEAAAHLYDFTWHTYCDWYLEIVKELLKTSTKSEESQEVQWVAIQSFKELLALLHPFVPFVTEEIYQKFNDKDPESALAQAIWKMGSMAEYSSKNGISTVMSIVSGIRSAKTTIGAPGTKLQVNIPGQYSQEIVRLIEGLGKVKLVEEADIPVQRAIKKPLDVGTLIIDHPNKQQYKSRLEQEVMETNSAISTLGNKLQTDFVTRAPPALVLRERTRLDELIKASEILRRELSSID